MLRTIARLVGAGATAGVLVAGLLLPAVGSAGATARDAALQFQNLPNKLGSPSLPQRTRILAADGTKIATLHKPKGNRVLVPYDKIAPVMRKAMVAIEDSRFYQHGGADLKGILRAFLINISAGEVRQGGSTLTQQYVKRVLLATADSKKERKKATAPTIARKVRELRYAIAVENRYSKREILTRYLNIAYFGDGAHGVQAAAEHYFSTTADKLTLTQAALIAGLVQSPAAYNPRLHPKKAKQRRNLVIMRMAQLGMVNKQRAQRAMRKPVELDVTETPNGCGASKAPFFCAYVVNEIQHNPAFGKTRKARNKLLYTGGLTIKTTLDLSTQEAAKKAVTSKVPPGESSGKAAAETMVEPGTGRIRAMAVSLDYGNDQENGETKINLAADYAHGGNRGAQSGSTFKVFTLATALKQGMPVDTTMNVPYKGTVSGFTDCQGNKFKPYTIRNAVRSESGKYDLRTGTWHSINTFFVKLEKRAGLCNVVKTIRSLGMETATGDSIPVIPSITLGTVRVDPTHLAAAYAGFAARGKYCKPIAISSVTTSSGKQIDVPGPQCKQVMEPKVADTVNKILQGVIDKGTAQGISIDRPAAGKTGTTDDNSAAWFAGYTPRLASAVWVGDPRGGVQHPLRNVRIGGRYYGSVAGASIPAPIWAATMRNALSGVPKGSFTKPPPSMRPESDEKKNEKKDEKDEEQQDRGGPDRPRPDEDERGHRPPSGPPPGPPPGQGDGHDRGRGRSGDD